MSVVMVLGANGRLGRAAALAFAQAGWQVLAQTRRAERAPWPAGAHTLQADALDVAALVKAATAKGARLDLIVQALNPDYTQWAKLLPSITAAGIALAEATGATLMLPGNVYNFGNQLPPVLTTATPFVASHPKAQQRIALEASLARAAERGVRSVVVRAGDFLGDAGTWMDLGLARQLDRGRVTHLGPQDVAHAWAYLPDLAQVFVRVAEERAALPAHAVLHYSGLTLTGAQMHALIEAALGRPLQAVGFPWWLMRLAAPFAAMPRALIEMRYLWQWPHRLDEQGLQRLIGAVPHTPAPEVVRRCVADLVTPASAAPVKTATPPAS